MILVLLNAHIPFLGVFQNLLALGEKVKDRNFTILSNLNQTKYFEIHEKELSMIFCFSSKLWNFQEKYKL